MANRNVNILLKLQDQFTRPMREAGVITRDQEKSMRKASQSVIGFSRNVRNGFLGGLKHVAKFGAALTGITGVLSVGALKSFASQSEELARKQIEAETKLEAVLGNVTSIAAGGSAAIAEAKKELMGVASELQRTGVIGDEVTLAGMQQLATFQLSADQIATLSTGMTDLLAQQKGLNATQEDAVSVANLIGKAMSGQVSALSRVGIIMDDNQKTMLQTGDATQRAAVLAEILQQNVGGVNEALADTDQGRLQQFANNWNDMKEQVGKRILSLKATIAGELVEYIPRIQEVAVRVTEKVSEYVRKGVGWLKDHAEQIKAALRSVKDGVAAAWGYIKPVIGFAVQHARTLIPAVLGVTAAISGVSIVADIAGKVMGLVSGFRTMITAAKGVFNILKVVRVAGFGPVGIAIAAVIAAGVLLYQNWDKIKEAAGKVKDRVVSAFNKIKEAIQPIVDLITAAKNGLEAIGFGSGNSNLNSNGYVSRIDHFATGTPYWKGGPTYVNEGRRGEIINLPSGTQIIPHDVSMAAAQSGGGNVTVNVSIQGNVIGNRAYAEELGGYIAGKILAAREVV